MERITSGSLFSHDSGIGYTFGGARTEFLARRLAYIQKHGASFLFNNTPPPVPGYPRNKNYELLIRNQSDATS
jgi:hypothetical protein